MTYELAPRPYKTVMHVETRYLQFLGKNEGEFYAA